MAVFAKKEIVSTCEHSFENLCRVVIFSQVNLGGGCQNFLPDPALIQTKFPSAKISEPPLSAFFSVTDGLDPILSLYVFPPIHWMRFYYVCRICI